MSDDEKKSASGSESLGSNKLVWLAGAIVLLIAGWFGLRAIFGSMESYKVSLIDAPNEVNAGSNAAFTWRVDGPATTINHTSVHFGTESTPGDLGKNVAPDATKYEDMIKDFANQSNPIPFRFIGNHTFDEAGTYYFRAHAIVNGEHYWTEEKTLEVAEATTKKATP